MTRLDVALATCRALPEPDPDEAPLLDALAAAGLAARSLAWDDPAAPFGDARVVLIRSTWNYVHHLDAFLAWVDSCGDRLVNPAPVVRWNHHKHYLADLTAHGVAAVPTEHVARGAGRRLDDVLAARGWGEAVAKPAVSAASFETRRVRAGDAEAAAWFDGVRKARDMMVQPYVRSVEAYGERSLVWVDSAVTHAIRKTPRFTGEGERVSSGAVAVADDERAFAGDAVRAAEALTRSEVHYARVDVVRDEAGALQVMELELIEPSLFFAQGPGGLARLTAALARRCGTVGG